MASLLCFAGAVVGFGVGFGSNSVGCGSPTLWTGQAACARSGVGCTTLPLPEIHASAFFFLSFRSRGSPGQDDAPGLRCVCISGDVFNNSWPGVMNGQPRFSGPCHQTLLGLRSYLRLNATHSQGTLLLSIYSKIDVPVLSLHQTHVRLAHCQWFMQYPDTEGWPPTDSAGLCLLSPIL